MKKLIVGTALLLIMPVWALAQGTDHHYRGQGNAVFSLGTARDRLSAVRCVGGGEVVSSGGIGLGGEYVNAASPFGEQMISANLFYHSGASKKGRRFKPFVTGGFNRLWTTYPAFGGNFGCGLNIWATKHVAVRLELRDTIGGRNISIEYEPYGNFYTASQNVVSFRIGMTFR